MNFDKNKIPVKKVILLAGLFLLVIGAFSFVCFSKNKQISKCNQMLIEKEDEIEAEIEAENKISETMFYEMEVEYIPMETVEGLDDMEITPNWPDNYLGSAIKYNISFRKVGNIKGGEHEGEELILGLVEYGPLGKGSSEEGRVLKIIRGTLSSKSKIITFLPNISSKIKLVLGAGIISRLEMKGYTIRVSDGRYYLPILENHDIEVDSIKDSTGDKIKLNYYNEKIGTIDHSKLQKIAVSDLYGDVYALSPELSDQKNFYEDQTSYVDNKLYYCAGENCFDKNAFLVFKPDGTFSMYLSENPEKLIKDAKLDDNDLSTWPNSYTPYITDSCRQSIADIHIISPDLLSDSDLTVVGELDVEPNSAYEKNIYKINDENHILYKKLFNDYLANVKESIWYNKKIYTREEFLELSPILVLKDKFGRMIQCNRQNFMYPIMCEPNIYLYPESEQDVSITIDPKVSFIATEPVYKNGWSVRAYPSGKIVNLEDNIEYPYLFWEGKSDIIPMRDEGFVVEKGEVEEFFVEILPKLGLNKKESKDFMKAWLPEFGSDPYYFITFIDQSEIDMIAPLNVNPVPDTSVRILMDFMPLNEYMEVPELEIPSVGNRDGFTLIEWGGLKR